MAGNHCNYYSFGVLLMAVGFVRGGGILYLSHYISAEKGPYGSIRDFLG